MHRYGIIHCDIKHKNVVIEEIKDELGQFKEYKANIIDLGSGILAIKFN